MHENEPSLFQNKWRESFSKKLYLRVDYAYDMFGIHM